MTETPQDAAQPNAAQPSAAQPNAAQPSAAQPSVRSQPAAPKPAAPKAAAAEVEVQVGPDVPWTDWPALYDRGAGPIRFPYDKGGVPLGMLLVYMCFLGMAFYYTAAWLVPDALSWFGE